MRVEQKIILTLICIALFFPAVSAYYEVTQGNTVYLGETVDISRVLSWKMQFAYWKNGEYGGGTPDKVITVSGYMYAYYIDPQLYEPGTYWKWDGKEEPASNPLAFYVKDGVRPEPTPTSTTNITNNGTSITNVTPVPTLPELPLGEHVLIARGDYGSLNYRMDNTKLINGIPQTAYLWLFGSTSKILGDQLLSSKASASGTVTGSDPFAQTSGSAIYTYEFNTSMTSGLIAGKYVGYLQFVGGNNQQDVFYDAGNKSLDSPFKAVTPLDITPFLPIRIMHEFETRAAPSIYCDDVLVPITVDIEQPTLTISDYWEEGENIVIEGTTNMAEGTNIVAMIDPDHYAIPAEIAAHKYSTKAVGDYSTMRTYSVSIPLKWDELNVGQHTFRVSIQKYGINLDVYKDFQVSGLWVMPTPTPEMKKVMVEEYGSHQLPTKTPTLTPAPTQGSTPTQPQVVVNGTVRNLTQRNQTIVRPANWTPNNTNITNNIANNTTVILTPPPTPIPTKTVEPTPTDDIVIPLNPALAVIAIVIIGFILKRK